LNHIVDLLALSESDQYKGEEKKLLVVSLRKTIIIHTASIVEALLLWKLKEVSKTEKIEMRDEWKYLDIRILYKINDSEEVVAGNRKKDKEDISRLDFIKITLLCKEHKIIRSDDLKIEIDKLRELRNKLHLGGLTEIEKEYRKSDVEFCFSVARRVKKLVSN